MMLTASIAAWAEYVEVNGLRIYLTTDQYAQVEAPETGVYTGDVVIPSSVSSGGVNYPVKVICAYAFQNATITSVSIPNTVETIDGNAFQNCASLTAITLPEGIKYISYYAFDGCPLTTVTIPGTVTSIRYYAFPTTITSLTFAAGEGTLSLDGYAFGSRFDNSITDLVIERNYQDDGRVELSSKIKRVTIGDAVTTIPEYALSHLTLESLIIGSNVTEIGQSAFSSTTLPAGYNFPFAQIKKIGSGAFSNCVNLPSNIDLTGVEEIGSYAFRECSLQSVILPMDVTSIGNNAFNISGLKVYAPWLTSPVSLANQYSHEDHDYQFNFNSSTLYVPAGTMATYQAQVGWKDFSAIDYWSFVVSATVARAL